MPDTADNRLETLPMQTRELEAQTEYQIAGALNELKAVGDIAEEVTVAKSTTSMADVRTVGYRVTCAHVSKCNCAAMVNKAIWNHWGNSSTATDYWHEDAWGHLANSSSASTANHLTWARWVSNSWVTEQQRVEHRAQQHQRQRYPGLTPEQQAAEDKRTADYHAARRIEDDRREAERKAQAVLIKVAQGKAEKLLLSALNEEQRKELKDKNYFHCKSKQGNLYRIRRGTHGNVKRVVNGKEVESLCIQPDNVPAEDAMLAQKLHIEWDEEQFRKTANITPIYN